MRTVIDIKRLCALCQHCCADTLLELKGQPHDVRRGVGEVGSQLHRLGQLLRFEHGARGVVARDDPLYVGVSALRSGATPGRCFRCGTAPARRSA